MEWTAPSYAEIKMDAEIGSYQEDFEPRDEPAFVGSLESEQVDATSSR